MSVCERAEQEKLEELRRQIADLQRELAIQRHGVGIPVAQFAVGMQRELVEEALRENEERLKLALSAAQMGTWEWNILTREFTWSDELLNILGLDRAEGITSDKVVNRIHPDDRKYVVQVVRQAAQEGKFYEIEYRIVHPDGQVRWVLSKGNAVCSPEGKPLRMLGVSLDITQRKAAEEALRRSEDALRESYERIRDLAGKLIVSQEEERKHIARELHDDLNQRVVSLAITIGNLSRQLAYASEPVRNQIAKLEQRTTGLYEHIRQISHELHSPALEHVGLVAALEQHCTEFAELEGVSVTLDMLDVSDSLSPEISLCLYRVVQESLRNIARHSGGRIARIKLRGSADGIELIVADEGRGFDTQQVRARGGL
ncbi:MAG: PAS domain-containing protein, partial [Blastocatellia bacterium]|nr:PAS domain-containing protein [Blastocatellia bacterium]